MGNVNLKNYRFVAIDEIYEMYQHDSDSLPKKL